ncbi:MAG: dTMP kinase [Gemmatirosa sp.]|nr:dTMP kinase [Gemmatirosa sp.]
MSERGRLVVFEGTEGVGKTTQLARLAGRLDAAGIPYDRFREPGDTPLGDRVRALLLDQTAVAVAPRAEALLFMAARAQLAERIRAALADGRAVLLDRFFLSTYAYQIAGRGLPSGPVRAANRLAVGELVPDLTLLLSCDLEVASARARSRGDLDRMEREDRDFHERVTTAFLAAADPAWQDAHPEVGPVERIDADGDVDTVGARVDAALVARWPETFRRLSESQ